MFGLTCGGGFSGGGGGNGSVGGFGVLTVTAVPIMGALAAVFTFPGARSQCRLYVI